MIFQKNLRSGSWMQPEQFSVSLSGFCFYSTYRNRLIGFRIVFLRDTRFVVGGTLPRLHYSPNFGYPWLSFQLVVYRGEN